MDIKDKMTKSIKEARACLNMLASGGVVGVKNCQVVSALWAQLDLLEACVSTMREESEENLVKECEDGDAEKNTGC